MSSVAPERVKPHYFLVIKPSIGIIYVLKSKISSPEAQKAELVVTRGHPREHATSPGQRC